ncbi:DNA polymerase III subunit delta' [Buchnera aphidicola (Cavariella theobaldi)]
MIWYPWLKKLYKIIITQHQVKKAHHSILINTMQGIGVFELIWHVSAWLLCSNRVGKKLCYSCYGCKMMLLKNHPDWHSIITEKNKLCNVTDIHNIQHKIYQCSQRGGNKIIFISNIDQLTESAVNALLKIIEEPPKNTWFFLVNYNCLYSYPTLSSRCVIYNLPIPMEKKSLLWLNQELKNNDNTSYLTALRVNAGCPITAKNFINGEIWKERIYFFQNIFFSFKNKNLINMLSILNDHNIIVKINWICLLLFDAIKFNINQKNYISNLDQMPLIDMLSRNYSDYHLDQSIHAWIKCKYRLTTILGINHELILLDQLLLWEKILNFSFTS